jgi:hypothetical protein
MNAGTPAHDGLNGRLLRIGGRRWVVLVVGGGERAAPGQMVCAGDLVVCYAVPYLYERREFVPHRVIDDFGREFEGNDALRFMVQKGDAFPRADVHGHWVETGEWDTVFLKQLDMAAGLEAFAYRSASSQLPLARLDAVVWVEDTPSAQPQETDEHDDRVPEMLRLAAPLITIGADQLRRLAGLLSAELSSLPGG